MEFYAQHPDKFAELEIEEQLAIIADIILYYAQKKTHALAEAGKTRVDSCLPAMEFYDLEKYWSNKNMNLKKIAELEITKAKRGI